MFLVISVYFNLRNILPKSGTFPPGHPVYIYIYIYIYTRIFMDVNISEEISASVFSILNPDDGGRDFARNFVTRLHSIQTIKEQIC